MQSTREELEQKTLAYWKLSQIWNGRRQVEVTTGDAMEMCSTILARTSIYRPVFHSVDGLLQEIIKGGGNPLPTATILPLPTKNKA